MLALATTRSGQPAAPSRISATGNANLFDAGPGTNLLTVSPNSVQNTFVLDGYGHGLTTIAGFGTARANKLMLTRTLFGISIQSDLSNLGAYLKATDGTAGTTLSVDPTGGSGDCACLCLSAEHAHLARRADF